MSKAIVLMTALLPTDGHAALLKFADTFCSDGVDLILSSRSFEPIPHYQRTWAIEDECPYVRIHNHRDDNAPQNPNPLLKFDKPFWDYWKNIIVGFVGEVKPDDCVIASEFYGETVAKVLGCRFIPFDYSRTYIPISGTEVRKDIFFQWEHILPRMRRELKKTVTFFGAESCGKTSMTNYISRIMYSPMVDEWARPYLETESVGPEVTEEKMKTIINGQTALQQLAREDLSSYFIFQDTDLFSTLGYYRIWGHKPPDGLSTLAEVYKSDLYIVMNDQIPFEKDILRYGENKRESTTQYWVDLLDEFKLNYYVVKKTDLTKQRDEIRKFLWDYYDKETDAIRDFVRD